MDPTGVRNTVRKYWLLVQFKPNQYGRRPWKRASYSELASRVEFDQQKILLLCKAPPTFFPAIDIPLCLSLFFLYTLSQSNSERPSIVTKLPPAFVLYTSPSIPTVRLQRSRPSNKHHYRHWRESRGHEHTDERCSSTREVCETHGHLSFCLRLLSILSFGCWRPFIPKSIPLADLHFMSAL